MIPFSSIDKSGGEAWHTGPDVFVEPGSVIAVEPREHSYHSFRPKQEYATLHLSTGATIDVFSSAARVQERIASFADTPRTAAELVQRHWPIVREAYVSPLSDGRDNIITWQVEVMLTGGRMEAVAAPTEAEAIAVMDRAMKAWAAEAM